MWPLGTWFYYKRELYNARVKINLRNSLYWSGRMSKTQQQELYDLETASTFSLLFNNQDWVSVLIQLYVFTYTQILPKHFTERNNFLFHKHFQARSQSCGVPIKIVPSISLPLCKMEIRHMGVGIWKCKFLLSFLQCWQWSGW